MTPDTKVISPQCAAVLRQLKHAGSITGVEAAAVMRVRHLPRRIKDLQEAGFNIRGEWQKDATGQRYRRYVLLDPR